MKLTVKTRFLGELDLDTVDFTDEVNSYIMTYGWKQALDDAGATKGREGSQTRYDLLADGRAPSSTGGAKLNSTIAATREVLADLYVAWGAKRAAAKKTAKSGKSALAGEVRDKLARHNRVPASTVASSEIVLQVDVIWPKVEAKAARIVALRNETLID